MLDHGASAGAGDKDGDLPLHLAAEKGHAPCVALLLDRGADLDAVDG